MSQLGVRTRSKGSTPRHELENGYERLFRSITKRYGRIDPQALEAVLCPVLIPIHTLDREVTRAHNQYQASFTIKLAQEYEELIQRGRTGKFVPKSYVDARGPWREIAKGRIVSVDREKGIATGEVYIGRSGRDVFELALSELSDQDYLEIDRYGAAAKVLSALVENSLSKNARQQGFRVRRMPEDMAKHLGDYYHYDFEFERDGITKRVEVKSLWGTDTECARLIHSKTKTYKTSSCKFSTQDIFAVSLFLRTGNIEDFAFARSVPSDVRKYGLPRSPDHPEYVHQNPICKIGDGTWFASIEEVWNLE